jgi:hypothetical protein
MNQYLAAHHESAHAVISVALGLPLQNGGIRIDTIGGGIAFNLHRNPGDLDNTPADIVERERSITAIKAGYLANLRLDPSCPPEVAADDRQEEISLLNEMHSRNEKVWSDTDDRLRTESQNLVDQHWNAIVAVAAALLAKPVTTRPLDSFTRWRSPDSQERWISGQEIDIILRMFQLNAIVRDESEGKYYAPDLHPQSSQ